MKPRVLVSQEHGQLDYTPAEAFGDVVFLTRLDWSPIPSSIANKTLVEEVRRGLKDFRPDVDYVTTSGSPVVSGIMFMILREKTDKLNFLRWSNRDHRYQSLLVHI